MPYSGPEWTSEPATEPDRPYRRGRRDLGDPLDLPEALQLRGLPGGDPAWRRARRRPVRGPGRWDRTLALAPSLRSRDPLPVDEGAEGSLGPGIEPEEARIAGQAAFGPAEEAPLGEGSPPPHQKEAGPGYEEDPEGEEVERWVGVGFGRPGSRTVGSGLAFRPRSTFGA